jgi:hypothetical protein
MDNGDEMLDADNTNDTAIPEFYHEALPVKVRDQNGRIFSLRKRKAFWRTHYVLPSSGEAYFYQKIILQLPSLDSIAYTKLRIHLGGVSNQQWLILT